MVDTGAEKLMWNHWVISWQFRKNCITPVTIDIPTNYAAQDECSFLICPHPFMAQLNITYLIRHHDRSRRCGKHDPSIPSECSALVTCSVQMKPSLSNVSNWVEIPVVLNVFASVRVPLSMFSRRYMVSPNLDPCHKSISCRNFHAIRSPIFQQFDTFTAYPEYFGID